MLFESRDLIANARKENMAAMAAAMKSGSKEEMENALGKFFEDVTAACVESAAMQAQTAMSDKQVLASRGIKPMTSEETAYFTDLCEVAKSKDPKMTLTDWNKTMPETVVTTALDDLRKNHPLLDLINMQNTSYLTKFIFSTQTKQTAAWGAITSTISQELHGAFDYVDMTLNKLTAYFVIPLDLLDLGPNWLYQYAVATMFEAQALALEIAVISGNGKNKPVGMDRNLAGPIDPNNGYPKQTGVALANLGPVELGKIVAMIARDPKDATQPRAVTDLVFVVNEFDYWEKILPATSFQTGEGAWKNNILPIPATIVRTVGLARNETILGIGKKYFLGVGLKKDALTSSDEYQFLEDSRTLKIKTQANGRPLDGYAFVLCDITNLDTTYGRPVQVTNTVKTKATT